MKRWLLILLCLQALSLKASTTTETGEIVKPNFSFDCDVYDDEGNKHVLNGSVTHKKEQVTGHGTTKDVFNAYLTMTSSSAKFESASNLKGFYEKDGSLHIRTQPLSLNKNANGSYGAVFVDYVFDMHFVHYRYRNGSLVVSLTEEGRTTVVRRVSVMATGICKLNYEITQSQ